MLQVRELKPVSLDRPDSTAVAALVRILDSIDRILIAACVAATIAAGLILTYSIVVRYAVHSSTDWQDEMAVFCLVGATFLSAPYVQAVRGHLGIEVISTLMPPGAERWRQLFSSMICLTFCAVFGHQCWILLLEAIESGEVTDSAWAPPLWIPYTLMTAGITLLTMRFLLQVVQGLHECRGPAR